MNGQKMRTTVISLLAAVAIATGIIALGVVSSQAGSQGWASDNAAYVLPKEDPVISPWAASVIAKRTEAGQVKVWVYFVDKGFANKAGMAAKVAAANVQLTARAAARRAKIGRDRIEFIDIPVHQPYVDQVAATGAKLRHTSRWLNAASFEVATGQLEAIAALPFVRKIDPVIGYHAERDDLGQPDKNTDSVRPKAAGPGDPPTLDYGASYDQLQQLNVPAVHALGYAGQNVLVCMMDTGYRKDHVAFEQAYLDGRVLAEHDFIFNDSNTQDESEDQPGQNNHGTYTWSALGGEYDGELYGPAYEADFILAKTEDIRSETQVEEDNWLAGVEWADSIGAQVISSSLVYKDWYVYANYNGDYCVTTNAADLAASLGIVVCNAMGNYGPSAGTLGAPADADSILACGAVNSSGTIASFSSRGPTADGRTKPEVCARGVSTRCANPGGTTGFTTASGTSLSTPLVGGCAAVLISAHPDWTVMQVREALMNTASNASTPDNDYGSGIIDLLAAVNYNDFTYTPGDLNYDEVLDILDLGFEIDIIFSGAAFPDPPVSPDLNLDGVVNPLDAVLLIDYLFRGGPAPSYPSA
jgi:serine protease AprX